ncbi:MAG: hypothetical protein JSR65_14480 [Proteobacteria bacterium]|nr:hypothetical protein [Pseudomonadota bacterium]
MVKKILIGMAAFAILCAIAGAGYSFGKHLSQLDNRTSAQVEPSAP